MNDTHKIDSETAKVEFDRFVVAMRLRLESSWVDENERRDITEDVAYLTTLIQEGPLRVDDEGRMVYKPFSKDRELTFRKPSGEQTAAIDRKKEHQKVGQQHALIGAITRTPPAMIAAMEQDDIDACATICGLFFVR